MQTFIIIAIFASFFFTIAEYIGVYQFMFGRLALKRDFTFHPKVSIMLTVFKEGQEVTDCVHSIMKSDYPLDLIEILMCDDCSPDDSYQRMELLEKEFPNHIRIMRNEENKGKPYTLLKLAALTNGEIIFNIDSDTIIAPDSIRKTVSCYSDADIGAVGATVRIKNVNDSLWTQLQTIQYWWCETFLKPFENISKTSRCLFGPMCSFRREAYMPLQDEIRKRNFLGVNVIHGEDTFITLLIALGFGRGKPWKIYTDPEAISWTGTPATMQAYLNQQLRWRKGTVTNGLYIIANLFKTTMTAGISTVLMSIILTLVLLIQFLIFIGWWLNGDFIGTMASIFLFFVLRGTTMSILYNVFFGPKDPQGRLKNCLMTGVLYAGWFMASWLILSIWGTFTLDNSGWLTRQKEGNVK